MLRNRKVSGADSGPQAAGSPGFFSRSSRLVGWGLLLGLCLTPPLAAVEGTSVMKIEEDWEIVIGDPNAEETAPQLYVVTSPTGNIEGQYSVFEINNVTLPDFYGGGLQYQTWWDDQATGEAHHDNFSSLATGGETITFTVRMSLWDNNCSYRIKNGQSSTWGSFGDNNSLWIVRPRVVSNLSAYSPENSARWSRVGFGRGRVTKFCLKQVRYYDANNDLLGTDTTERDALVEEPQ